jgi:hypothetical protein
MVRCLLAMACVLAATAGWAQADDRLTSADCRRALGKLQALEAEALAKPAGSARQAVVKELDAQRPDAARLCLGGTGKAPPPSARYSLPMMQPKTPPIAPLPAPAAPRPAVPLPQPMPPVSLPPPADKLRSVTSCDASGCWASDGTHLQRLGPDLIGPWGVCTLQGGVLRCP